MARKRATHPAAPAASAVSGKSPRRRKTGGAASPVSASLRSRIHKLLGNGRLAQAAEAAVEVAEVTLVGGAASALSGYREAQGKNLKLGPVDGRVAAGLAFLGYSMWKPGRIEPHSLNVGTGFLSSFFHEAAFETGAKYGVPATSTAGADEGAGAEGLVIGNLHDQSGLFGIALTKKAKLKKLEKKDARLDKKEAKVEAKIEKIKGKLAAKGKLPASAPAALPAPGVDDNVVQVRRGVRVFGPRGKVLPGFAARFPRKAAKIRAGARVVPV